MEQSRLSARHTRASITMTLSVAPQMILPATTPASRSAAQLSASGWWAIARRTACSKLAVRRRLALKD
jgi:hypothetical protein